MSIEHLNLVLMNKTPWGTCKILDLGTQHSSLRQAACWNDVSEAESCIYGKPSKVTMLLPPGRTQISILRTQGNADPEDTGREKRKSGVPE